MPNFRLPLQGAVVPVGTVKNGSDLRIRVSHRWRPLHTSACGRGLYKCCAPGGGMRAPRLLARKAVFAPFSPRSVNRALGPRKRNPSVRAHRAAPSLGGPPQCCARKPADGRRPPVGAAGCLLAEHGQKYTRHRRPTAVPAPCERQTSCVTY